VSPLRRAFSARLRAVDLLTEAGRGIEPHQRVKYLRMQVPAVRCCENRLAAKDLHVVATINILIYRLLPKTYN
jgi:hypothetical protein